MEANGKLSMEGDKNTTRKRDTGGAEVVLVIPGEREALKEENRAVTVTPAHAGSYSSKDLEAFAPTPASVETPQMGGRNSNVGPSELEILRAKVQMSTSTSCSSLETQKFTQSPKPPKVPTNTLTRRRSLWKSVYSKPKSRFVDLSGPTALNIIEGTSPLVHQHDSESLNSPYGNSPNRVAAFTPRENIRTAPVTPRTPLMASPGGEEEDDEIYKTENLKTSKRLYEKWKIGLLIEWTTLVFIMGFLIASLTIYKMQHTMIWGLEIWKWCVLLTVIFCGRLVTDWVVHFLVFLIERNFLLNKKALYYMFRLKKGVQVCIWLALVLLAWTLLISHGVKRSRHTIKILNHVSKAIASSLIGALIWLVKTLLLKIVASSFRVNAFFDRIQESIFHQYVLQTLSGPPLMELAEMVGISNSRGQLSFRNIKKGKGGEEQEVIDVGKLHKMKQDKVSPSTMKGLINLIRSTGLSTLSNKIDGSVFYEESDQKDEEITNEWEAKAAAYQIFRKIAKTGRKYIEEEDLRRFLNKEEVDNVLPLFEGAVETGMIKKSALLNWLVKVYLERKSLAHSLNDTKIAVKQLNRLVSCIVIVVITIVWLVLMGIATTKVLLFISSQLLVVVFMFGNTCKTVFEALIFVFVMHPYDVGDRCVIDGVQMIVEEMHILTTVFLKDDNGKIYYPNSVLATKPINNFYRSPEMSDFVDFSVDVSTSMESIGALKARIKAHIESKPQHWNSDHSVVVKDIENMNKMNMALYVLHTMNHQNYGEKTERLSELTLQLKNIFEELSIEYHLPPQEVHLRYVG